MVWRVADVVDMGGRSLWRIAARLGLDRDGKVRHVRRKVVRLSLPHRVVEM